MASDAIPKDKQAEISAAVSAMFPGVSLEWSSGDPVLVIPLSLRLKAPQIVQWMVGYAHQIGVSIVLPANSPVKDDQDHDPSITYPTR